MKVKSWFHLLDLQTQMYMYMLNLWYLFKFLYNITYIINLQLTTEFNYNSTIFVINYSSICEQFWSTRLKILNFLIVKSTNALIFISKFSSHIFTRYTIISIGTGASLTTKVTNIAVFVIVLNNLIFLKNFKLILF